RVSVLDRDAARRAGIEGVLLRVGRADPGTGSGRLTVRVDYREFRDAYGGGWSSRLRLMAVPDCALSVPDAADCHAVMIPSVNDQSALAVTGEVEMGPQLSDAIDRADLLVALTAGPSSDGGS